MRKIVFIFAMLSVSVFANTQKIGANYSLKFETGQRVDNFDWNINYLQNQTPNILSELTWSDVETYYGKISLYGEEGPYRLKVSYAKTTDANSGKNQDSDYAQNNRQGETERSNNSAKGSNFEDFSIAIGDSYKIGDNQNLIIWIGYEQNRQYFHIQDVYQTIPIQKSHPGLHSTYEATWNGVNVGLEYQLGFSDFKINTSAYYHLMKYEADANWSSGRFQRPLSFQQKFDKTTGISAFMSIDYKLTENTILSINYDYRKFEGKDGKNIQYLAIGGIGGDRVNEVNWESQKLALGIEYKF